MMQHDLIEFSQSEFEEIAKAVYNHLGIVLADHKKQMVYRRLSKRIFELKLNSFTQYIQYLNDNEDEFAMLANAITTNLTKFFREIHHFEHLEKVLIEHIAKNKSLRIWSAGCSNGSEAYTIAMTVAELISGQPNYDFKILATDIDTNMLEEGRNGMYDMSFLNNPPQKYQKYYNINKDGMSFNVSDSLKKYVHFKKLNLFDPWPISIKFDIIFCRNVIIYFDKPTQKSLFVKFADAIKPAGFMYIGHSESLNNISDKFDCIGKTIYQRVYD